VTPDDERIEVPISAIEHYSYCPRQYALIHVDQTFEENLFTMRGHRAHERVHAEEDSTVRGVPVRRGLSLWSDRLRLRGKADLVELRPEGPYPVEYKVGRRLGIHADLQLCAQALCLEEMLDTSVPKGALFYWTTRRRHEVVVDADLRRRTLDIVEAVRELLQGQRLPDAPNDARCPRCSLIDACLPGVVAEAHRLRGIQGELFSTREWPSDA
jgi:CRISPR-associated exonuclease Cas4